MHPSGLPLPPPTRMPDTRTTTCGTANAVGQTLPGRASCRRPHADARRHLAQVRCVVCRSRNRTTRVSSEISGDRYQVLRQRRPHQVVVLKQRRKTNEESVAAILSSRSIAPCHYPLPAVASDPTGQEVVHGSNRRHAAVDRRLPSPRRAPTQRPSGHLGRSWWPTWTHGLSLISVSG